MRRRINRVVLMTPELTVEPGLDDPDDNELPESEGSGSYLVRYKSHNRRYTTGLKQVVTYSAQCPGSPERKRLKQVLGNIYRMMCGDDEYLIDIASGEHIIDFAHTIERKPASPPDFTLVTSAEFARVWSTAYIYGIEYREVETIVPTGKSLTWKLFYFDTELIHGAGVAADGDEILYASF